MIRLVLREVCDRGLYFDDLSLAMNPLDDFIHVLAGHSFLQISFLMTWQTQNEMFDREKLILHSQWDKTADSFSSHEVAFCAIGELNLDQHSVCICRDHFKWKL